MWLMINLAPGAQTVTDFYFHYIRVTLLRIAIGNEKGFFSITVGMLDQGT